MTHSREALVLRSLYTKWSGQARHGGGKVSSCLLYSRSKEGLGQECVFSALEQRLALGLACSGFLGRNTSAMGIVQWEEKHI